METALMDESKKGDNAAQTRRRSQPPGGGAEMPTQTQRAMMAPALADIAEEPKSQQDATDAELLDPRDARTQKRLTRRLPGGSYDVPETALVRAIRAWEERGEQRIVRMLCETLVERCMPEFERRSWGLRHRPDLMEDAIAGMTEQLLREARDPREKFMTMNFIHYLRCLCADNFSRVLRQEGLSYRRDEQGRPSGRPQHVPQALVDRIDVAAEDQDDAMSHAGVVADPRDTLEEHMAAVEAQRILGYLTDPMDRQIMVLRALEHMRWDDIAKICGKTERTMRLRYEKSVVKLRERMESEAAMVAF